MTEFCKPYDLLGDPIPANWGKRGRPAHMPDDEKRNKIMLLLAMGWEQAELAAALGITQPTLRKHYFSLLKQKQQAKYRVRAANISMIWDKAKAGDVGAMREFRRLLDKADSEEVEREFLSPAPSEQVRKHPLGKKEVQTQEAAQAGLGTEWGSDLLPETMQ